LRRRGAVILGGDQNALFVPATIMDDDLVAAHEGKFIPFGRKGY
jgi:hypothetical protein